MASASDKKQTEAVQVAGDWFKMYFGITEQEWVNGGCKVDAGSIRCHEDVGTFCVVKCEDLLANLACEERAANTEKVLEVWTRRHFANEKCFDTSALQAAAEDGVCMFQVASNFDALARAHYTRNVRDGEFMHDVMTDCSQEPSAAGGAPAAAALRMSRQPINLLDKISVKDFPVKNGKVYLKWTETGMEKFEWMDVCVGLHCNARAVFDRSGDHLVYNKDGPRIHQVFVSTCIQSDRSEKSEISTKFLRAAYTGAYICAIDKNVKFLYLTVVGGGCFANNYGVIAKELADAHATFGAYLRKDCRVILALYEPNDPFAEVICKAMGRNAVIVDKTGDGK